MNSISLAGTLYFHTVSSCDEMASAFDAEIFIYVAPIRALREARATLHMLDRSSS
jgi:hypothetical protein